MNNHHSITVSYTGKFNWKFEFKSSSNNPIKVDHSYKYVSIYQSYKEIFSKSDCQSSGQYYEILDFEKNKDNSIKSLAINFKKSCDDKSIMLGAIRFHSKVPVNSNTTPLENPLIFDVPAKNPEKKFLFNLKNKRHCNPARRDCSSLLILHKM